MKTMMKKVKSSFAVLVAMAMFVLGLPQSESLVYGAGLEPAGGPEICEENAEASGTDSAAAYGAAPADQMYANWFEAKDDGSWTLVMSGGTVEDAAAGDSRVQYTHRSVNDTTPIEFTLKPAAGKRITDGSGKPINENYVLQNVVLNLVTGPYKEIPTPEDMGSWIEQAEWISVSANGYDEETSEITFEITSDFILAHASEADTFTAVWSADGGMDGLSYAPADLQLEDVSADDYSIRFRKDNVENGLWTGSGDVVFEITANPGWFYDEAPAVSCSVWPWIGIEGTAVSVVSIDSGKDECYAFKASETELKEVLKNMNMISRFEITTTNHPKQLGETTLSVSATDNTLHPKFTAGVTGNDKWDCGPLEITVSAGEDRHFEGTATLTVTSNNSSVKTAEIAAILPEPSEDGRSLTWKVAPGLLNRSTEAAAISFTIDAETKPDQAAAPTILNACKNAETGTLYIDMNSYQGDAQVFLAGKGVKYESNNDKAATVDPDTGIITTVSPGEVIFTANGEETPKLYVVDSGDISISQSASEIKATDTLRVDVTYPMYYSAAAEVKLDHDGEEGAFFGKEYAGINWITLRPTESVSEGSAYEYGLKAAITSDITGETLERDLTGSVMIREGYASKSVGGVDVRDSVFTCSVVCKKYSLNIYDKMDRATVYFKGETDGIRDVEFAGGGKVSDMWQIRSVDIGDGVVSVEVGVADNVNYQYAKKHIRKSNKVAFKLIGDSSVPDNYAVTKQAKLLFNEKLPKYKLNNDCYTLYALNRETDSLAGTAVITERNCALAGTDFTVEFVKQEDTKDPKKDKILIGSEAVSVGEDGLKHSRLDVDYGTGNITLYTTWDDIFQYKGSVNKHITGKLRIHNTNWIDGAYVYLKYSLGISTKAPKLKLRKSSATFSKAQFKDRDATFTTSATLEDGQIENMIVQRNFSNKGSSEDWKYEVKDGVLTIAAKKGAPIAVGKYSFMVYLADKDGNVIKKINKKSVNSVKFTVHITDTEPSISLEKMKGKIDVIAGDTAVYATLKHKNCSGTILRAWTEDPRVRVSMMDGVADKIIIRPVVDARGTVVAKKLSTKDGINDVEIKFETSDGYVISTTVAKIPTAIGGLYTNGTAANFREGVTEARSVVALTYRYKVYNSAGDYREAFMTFGGDYIQLAGEVTGSKHVTAQKDETIGRDVLILRSADANFKEETVRATNVRLDPNLVPGFTEENRKEALNVDITAYGSQAKWK